MSQKPDGQPAKTSGAGQRKKPRANSPKISPARPGYATHAQYVQVDGGQILKPGLYWHGVRNATNTDTFICSPLEVIAMTSDDKGENYGRLLRFLTPKGEWREWAAPMEMLSGDGGELRAELLRMGVIIPHKQRQALTDYIMESVPKRHALAATATGWHSPTLFVMPSNIIGSGDVVLQSTETGSHEYTTAGSLEGWRDNVAALCRNNPVPIMAVCAALAGPLLWMLDVDSGGFHFMGDSSSGKSVAALVACSVWGEPRSFKRNWNATSTGLEGLATMRNDTALILDEIGEASAKDIGGMIYQLGNGTGRQRGKVSGMARPVNVWRTMLISTGEMTVGKHMESGGQRIKAGQEMRLLDIPALRHYGVFDFLHGMSLPHNPANEAERRGAGRKFAETLRSNASAHYGHAGPEFVRWLISHIQTHPAGYNGNIQTLTDMFATLRDQFPVSSGQEARAAARFSLCALAGEMAITAGILPWEQEEALAATRSIFESWLVYRGRGQSEDAKILRAFASFIALHEARFEGMATNEYGSIPNRAGWWRANETGEKVLYFASETLAEAAPGYDRSRVVACLDNVGAIVERDAGRNTKRIRAGSFRPHVYAIDANAILSATDT
ncbi:DUF927 domain-containing protein [Klebsiella variicola]|uniref:DUF927 domain-containing protein n=1 Tax=Klebsiella variicola TaxID=244366 RepID=UPI001CCE70BB|nr:DUF927 domain-containing protein [Klebsiella variicola]MBZ7205130.1 DUF927 domain-containing protein [Klebsiella variicola]MDT7003625.1 hypothetical protein [Klebsiella variicola]MDT7028281.1 hypothetical protein [Klebsiella variicola]